MGHRLRYTCVPEWQGSHPLSHEGGTKDAQVRDMAVRRRCNRSVRRAGAGPDGEPTTPDDSRAEGRNGSVHEGRDTGSSAPDAGIPGGELRFEGQVLAV